MKLRQNRRTRPRRRGRIAALAARGDAVLEQRIELALQNLSQVVDEIELRRALDRADVAGVVAASWDDAKARALFRAVLEPRLEELVRAVAEIEWAGLRQRLEKADIPVEPAATASQAAVSQAAKWEPWVQIWSIAQLDSLVQGLVQSSREALRRIVARSLRESYIGDQVRLIESMIGLTLPQMNALFAFAKGQPSKAAFAEYEKRLRHQRAVVIARTETNRVAHVGQEAAWARAEHHGWLDPAQTWQQWVITHDSRLDKDVCEPMEGQTVLLHGMFITGKGHSIAMPPAHPQCRCSRRLVFNPPLTPVTSLADFVQKADVELRKAEGYWVKQPRDPHTGKWIPGAGVPNLSWEALAKAGHISDMVAAYQKDNPYSPSADHAEATLKETIQDVNVHGWAGAKLAWPASASWLEKYLARLPAPPSDKTPKWADIDPKHQKALRDHLREQFPTTAHWSDDQADNYLKNLFKLATGPGGWEQAEATYPQGAPWLRDKLVELGLVVKPSDAGTIQVPGLPAFPAAPGDKTLEYLQRDLEKEGVWKPKGHASYGGVVVNDQGQILLREPKGHYQGYVWTFPKGGQDAGEPTALTAVREVAEETGLLAGIVGHVPETFGSTGGNSSNYYLMRASSAPQAPSLMNGETLSLKWVSFAEAKGLISQTQTEVGRKRDLAVLAAAEKAWKAHLADESAPSAPAPKPAPPASQAVSTDAGGAVLLVPAVKKVKGAWPSWDDLSSLQRQAMGAGLDAVGNHHANAKLIYEKITGPAQASGLGGYQVSQGLYGVKATKAINDVIKGKGSLPTPVKAPKEPRPPAAETPVDLFKKYWSQYMDPGAADNLPLSYFQEIYNDLLGIYTEQKGGSLSTTTKAFFDDLANKGLIPRPGAPGTAGSGSPPEPPGGPGVAPHVSGAPGSPLAPSVSSPGALPAAPPALSPAVAKTPFGAWKEHYALAHPASTEGWSPAKWKSTYAVHSGNYKTGKLKDPTSKAYFDSLLDAPAPKPAAPAPVVETSWLPPPGDWAALAEENPVMTKLLAHNFAVQQGMSDNQANSHLADVMITAHAEGWYDAATQDPVAAAFLQTNLPGWASGLADTVQLKTTATAPSLPQVSPKQTVSHWGAPDNYIPTDIFQFAQMEKVPGPSGAQPGIWYKDAGGHAFYVKPAKSPSAAHNEVGGMKVYEAAGLIPGVDIPHVDVLTNPTSGDHFVASQKIEGLHGATAAEWQADAGARAEAQMKFFAVNVLTSHYDAVGANPEGGFDNTLLTSDGHPVLIEAGGSMARTGLLAKKATWVLHPNEEAATQALYQEVLAAQGKSSSHHNKSLAAVYGDMPDQTVAQLLGQLAKTFDIDALSAAWQSQGMPDKNREANLAIIKQRLDAIPAVMEMLGHDFSKGKLAASSDQVTFTGLSPVGADSPTGGKLTSVQEGYLESDAKQILSYLSEKSKLPTWEEYVKAVQFESSTGILLDQPTIEKFLKEKGLGANLSSQAPPILVPKWGELTPFQRLQLGKLYLEHYGASGAVSNQENAISSAKYDTEHWDGLTSAAQEFALQAWSKVGVVTGAKEVAPAAAHPAAHPVQTDSGKPPAWAGLSLPQKEPLMTAYLGYLASHGGNASYLNASMNLKTFFDDAHANGWAAAAVSDPETAKIAYDFIQPTLVSAPPAPSPIAKFLPPIKKGKYGWPSWGDLSAEHQHAMKQNLEALGLDHLPPSMVYMKITGPSVASGFSGYQLSQKHFGVAATKAVHDVIKGKSKAVPVAPQTFAAPQPAEVKPFPALWSSLNMLQKDTLVTLYQGSHPDLGYDTASSEVKIILSGDVPVTPGSTAWNWIQDALKQVGYLGPPEPIGSPFASAAAVDKATVGQIDWGDLNPDAQHALAGAWSAEHGIGYFEAVGDLEKMLKPDKHLPSSDTSLLQGVLDQILGTSEGSDFAPSVPSIAPTAGPPPKALETAAEWVGKGSSRPASLPKSVATVGEVRAAFQSGEVGGIHGWSIPFDARQVEDLNVRIVRMQNQQGEKGYLLKLKVTNSATIKANPKWTESSLADWNFKRSADGSTLLEQPGSGLSSVHGQGQTRRLSTDWGEIRHHSTAAASDALVQVFVREDQFSDETMQDLAKLIGAKPDYPSSEDLRAMAESRLLHVFAPKAAKSADRAAALKKIAKDWNVRPEDLAVGHDASGQIEFLLPDQVVQAMIAKYEVEAFAHQVMGGNLMDVLTHPARALLSTVERHTEGVSSKGMSSTADMGTGGADYVFTRQGSYASTTSYGGSQGTFVIDASRVLRRMDWHAYTSDSYGTTTKGKYETRSISALSAKSGSQETMFKRRVSLDDVEYVIVHDPVKVIQQLQAEGWTSWTDGRPLEQVIVKTGTSMTPRGGLKTFTKMPIPLKPFAVAANAEGDGPESIQISVPAGHEPKKMAAWKGVWEPIGQPNATQAIFWKWTPVIESPDVLLAADGQKIPVSKASPTSDYKLKAYTVGPNVPPQPYMPQFGVWKAIGAKTNVKPPFQFKWGYYLI